MVLRPHQVKNDLENNYFVRFMTVNGKKRTKVYVFWAYFWTFWAELDLSRLILSKIRKIEKINRCDRIILRFGGPKANWPKSKFFLTNGRWPFFCSSSQEVQITHWCKISGSLCYKEQLERLFLWKLYSKTPLESGRCHRKKLPTVNWPKSKIYLPVGRLAVFMVCRWPCFVAAHRGSK